jgi:hypothetical protein
VTGGDDRGGGIGGFDIAKEEEKPLGGTGGAAGAGARAGKGQPSGEGIATGNGTESEEATEAAALGNLDDHDQTPALEYGEGDRPRGATTGEALGAGAGTHVGSGTSAGTAGIGGGKPPGEEGPADSGGTRRPSGTDED